MESIFFIFVKKLVNRFLIADGWRVGAIVIDTETAYGPTFEIQDGTLTGYASRAIADDLVRKIGSRHVGIEYEVVEYCPRST